MRIGALRGVKGDPIVDISTKGLFEESEKPYNINNTQVEMCDLVEAKKQRMHKERSQQKFADGAIQYDSQNSEKQTFEELEKA